MKKVAVSDMNLIKKFKAGDESAFEELVKRYQKKVYNTTYRMMGNREDANDLAQEAFLRVYRKLDRFKGNSSFSTWLFTVTTNLCRDEMRKRQRRLQTTSLSEKERNIPDEMMSPEDLSLQRELRDKLQQVIDKLPNKHREVIILREFQGLSYDEIAEVTGVSMGTVKSRLSRARRSIKQELKSRNL